MKDELIMIVRRKRAPRTDTVELSKEALELLKRTSVAFHHLPPAAKSPSLEKQDTALTAPLPQATAAALARRYVKGS